MLAISILSTIGFIIRLLFIDIGNYIDKHCIVVSLLSIQREFHSLHRYRLCCILRCCKTCDKRSITISTYHLSIYTSFVYIHLYGMIRRSYTMIPNHYLFPNYGKVFFSIVDILSGITIYSILTTTKIETKNALLYTSLWILNPLVIVITTRGSSDTVECYLVFLTIQFLIQKKIVVAAIIFGLSVHFKVYPIVYSLLFFLYCYQLKDGKRSNGMNALVFAFVSGFTFVLLTYAFYRFYGITFVQQTLLYHASRVDIRHNYSVLFYPLYLFSSFPKETGGWVWIPHFLLFPVISLLYCNDLFYGVFLLSFLFVMFNKVVTAQYFLWWVAPLILIIPYCSLTIRQWIGLFSVFLLSQNLWNYYAYRLEFGGENVFLLLWLCCIMFFLTNLVFVLMIMRRRKEYPKGIKSD